MLEDIDFIDREIDFSIDKFLQGFAHDEPRDLDSYITGGGKEYCKLGLIKRNLEIKDKK
jgi:hypothetical protein